MNKKEAINIFGVYYEVLTILNKFSIEKPSNKDFFIKIIENLGHLRENNTNQYVNYEAAFEAAKKEIINNEYFLNSKKINDFDEDIDLSQYLINEHLPDSLNISIKFNIGDEFFIFNENKLKVFIATIKEYDISNEVIYYMIKDDEGFQYSFTEKRIHNNKISNNIIGLNIFLKKDEMISYISDFVLKKQEHLSELINNVSKL